jgi:hypothetical protein
MEEVQLFLIRLGIALLGAFLVGAACSGVARRKGRDTVGWYLTSFFPALFGFLLLLLAFPEKVTWWLSGILLTLLAPGILLALPGVETPGQTKPCGDCGKIIGWKLETCPWCGSASAVPEWQEGTRVRRPLRSCFLYLSLFTLLMLIVFGFIGYFCVPDEPREPGPAIDLTRHGS